MPHLIRTIAAIAALTGVLAGCRPDDPPEAAPEIRSGTLLVVNDTLRFRSCNDSGPGVTVFDRSTEALPLLEELAPAERQITAVVEITGDTLTAIRYAAPEGPACASLPPDGSFEARGQEPFWHLQVAADSIVIRTPDALDGITRRGSWQATTAGAWRFASGDTLAVSITAERCADAMSGARHPFRVTLTRGGVAMTGCGLEGRAGLPR